MLGAQMIDAACIDGAHQILIDLILGILVALRAVAETESVQEVGDVRSAMKAVC